MSDLLSAKPAILRLTNVLGLPKDVGQQEGSASCLAE